MVSALKLGFALSALFLIFGCEQETPAPAEQFQPRSHFLADGDPAAGEQAFMVDVIAYLRSARGDHEKQTQK